jgi:hypothetical protein
MLRQKTNPWLVVDFPETKLAETTTTTEENVFKGSKEVLTRNEARIAGA